MSSHIKISYYDQFKCMADQCPFSCCQQWKIGVDERTYEKWEGKTVKGNNEKTPVSLCSCVKEIDEGKVISLNKEKNCPFLNENKLCHIVLEHGEDYLSETCTTFPRQINRFNDRIEYSLDACCPVVIDIMRDYKEKNSFMSKVPSNKKEDMLFLVRKMILEIMEQAEYSLPERLMMIFYSLLELFEEESLTAKKIEKAQSKSYLQPVAEAIRKMPFQTMDTIYEGNELFLDVVENYRSQGLYTDFLEKVASFAEDLEEVYTEKELVNFFGEFIKLFASYENLIKNYLVAEIFGSGLLEDMELEDMLIAFQWVSMEYAAIRQAIFLKWLMQKEPDRKQLSYEFVRDYVMIISRVTGYDQEDIREYLENSFEEVIWEWGYEALVVGNGCM